MDSELPSANLRFMNQEFVKLDRFDGQNYTRWVEKVKFMLMVLKLYYILDPSLPPIPANPIPKERSEPDQKEISDLEKQRMKRKEDEDLCLGHIKNSLSDRLFDLYVQVTDPRDLWKALEAKYKAHEEGTNKYLVSKYLDFHMVDDKPIMEQVHELQVLVNKLRALSVVLPELFQVKNRHIVGMANLKLSRLTPEILHTQTYDIHYNDMAKSQGKIMLEVVYKPFSDYTIFEDVSPVQKAPVGSIENGGLLVITIHEGKKLQGKHHSHPHVLLLFQGESRETVTMKKNNNPIWEQKFTVMLEKPPAEEILRLDVMSTSWRKLFYKERELNRWATPLYKPF